MPPNTAQDGNGSGARLEFRITLTVILLALVVWQMPPRWQTPVASSVRATALRPFLALRQGLLNAEVRAEEASVLQERIDSLTARVMSQTTLEEENRQLRGLLYLGPRVGPRWLPVLVMRTGSSGDDASLNVDAGRDRGVLPGAAIITREGLAGRIQVADTDLSVGYDWTHQDFSASAMTQDGVHFGIVGPVGEAEADDLGEGSEELAETHLLFRGLRFSAEVEPGTVVVTSGLGDLPRGLPVGRVVGLARTLGEWRKDFWVEPFVEAGSVTVALVELPGPSRDPSGAWAGEGLLRAGERLGRDAFPQDSAQGRLDREALLEDSLRILRDSIARLRNRVRDPGPGGA